MRRGRNFRSPGLRSHEQLEKRNVAWKKEIKSPVESDSYFSFQTRQFQKIDVRQSHQAKKPENLNPQISATAHCRPSDASIPIGL